MTNPTDPKTTKAPEAKAPEAKVEKPEPLPVQYPDVASALNYQIEERERLEKGSAKPAAKKDADV
jgi:hypothetical protein